MSAPRRKRVFVGLTGGSGHAYGERLVRELVAAGVDVSLSATAAARKVLLHERGVDIGADGMRLAAALPAWLGADVAAHVHAHASDAVEAPPSSGTALTDGVVICPCSMGTLARVSVGFSSSANQPAEASDELCELIGQPRSIQRAISIFSSSESGW